MKNRNPLHIFLGRLVCIFLILSTLQQSDAQTNVNPFDLLPRLSGSLSPDSTIAITTSTNPFDIVKIRPASRTVGPRVGLEIVEQARPLSSKQKEAIYNRLVFISILVLFVILTLVVTIFRLLIQKVWQAFTNDNLLNQLIREQGAGVTMAYTILYIVFLLNAGFFMFLVCQHYGIKLHTSNVVGLLICLGAVTGFFLLKPIMLSIVGFVFPVGKEVNTYNFTITIFNIIIGFFLVPAILLLAYAPKELTPYIINGTVILLGLTYIFRGLRGIFTANRFLSRHKFHFLLYLCAVEIAPLMIIAKLLIDSGGIH